MTQLTLSFATLTLTLSLASTALAYGEQPTAALSLASFHTVTPESAVQAASAGICSIGLPPAVLAALAIEKTVTPAATATALACNDS